MINLDKINLDKSKYILIGVSGGADSMSLLDILCNAGYNIIVCHVNYHRRPTSDRDEQIVKEYCVSHSIKFYKLDSYEYEDNFQDYARDVRYNFFKEIYDKYNCQALMTAHHLNDKLETYLFKKQNNRLGRSLTIEEIDNIYGMCVIRPLLDTFKKDLEQYCVSHSIKYGVDESNLENHYSRNRIRHLQIDTLSDKELNDLINKMNVETAKWKLKYNQICQKINQFSINLVDFLDFSLENQVILLIEFINQNCPKLSNKIKKGTILNMIDKINKGYKNKYNFYIIYDDLLDNKQIILEKNKEYKINIIDKKGNKELKQITINSFENMPKDYFVIEENNDKKYGILINDDDFPLTIRSYNENDYIDLKNGHQKINRFFINKKIPIEERKYIPILVNNKNEILLIKGLYRKYDRKSLKNNVYMLK